MKRIFTKKFIICGILAALVLVSGIICPVAGSSDDSSSTGSTSDIQISCRYPGQIVDAGENVTFSLTIKNNGGNSNSRRLRVDSFRGEENWKFKFMTGDQQIDRLSLPEGESETVNLEVKTAGDTPVDTYQIRVSMDDGSIWLYVIIDKTHAGENGVLKLEVVNEQGEDIKGAKVSAICNENTAFDTQVFSTSDGQVRTELDQGTYSLLVEKNGYLNRTIDDVNIQSGYTEDLEKVMLERKNYGLDIDVKTPVVTSPIGDKPLYEIKLMNVGKSDDTFTLSYSDMPDGWYARYKESSDANSEVSEVFIKAGDEKTVYMEVIPPYSVTKGSYEFNSDIISSDKTEYKTDLKATIKGSADLEVFSEKYLYEITKGDTVNIPIKILNNGNGVALTNVITNVTTPEGWKVTISPETIPAIEPGSKDTVTLKVVPPSNIAASEYKITVKITSDQNEVSDSIRVTVKENSMIGVFGIIMILIVAGGVYYMYRKYERR
ncbi:putative membrane protein [Methanomicrobium sp. W14]|uniref:NEW3 domain-containing protein n=1 Tax=Methanomicrobium sp. W14 TaxID=2817839 RepID=UPI001AE5EA22|nr:NEW3 domain-containing protein [Methanomicrobium sp. W14]MBP2133953.1 putative membrane protein [Methanomicrobium sp. W14]